MKKTVLSIIFSIAKSAVLSICVLLLNCGKKNSTGNSVISNDSTTNEKPPALTGRLVFHSYSCYGCNDSKMYLFDFSAKTLTQINANWKINNCMNAHFSPDGKKLVFMGTTVDTNNWDIFMWDMSSSSDPVNLTVPLGTSSRDEDPKFSNGGQRIVFKHNGHLAEMDLSGNITRVITSGPGEESMPYYSYNDSLILFAEGSGAASDIYFIKTDSTVIKTQASLPGVEEYYPIGNDSVSFYYTSWLSASNANDQVFRGYYDTKKASDYLPFNNAAFNFSDPFPCGASYIFLSATRSDSKGGYDLYIADVKSGKVWSMDYYNTSINSANDELGSCYTDK